MPPKRRRGHDLEDPEETQAPRTPKKARRHGYNTPNGKASGQRINHGTNHFEESDGQDLDDDELALAQVTQSPQRQESAHTTPSKPIRKVRTPKKVNGIHGINETPTKSTVKKPRHRLENVESQDEDDPAANLILQVAEDASEDEDYQAIVSDVEEETELSNGVPLQGGFEAYFEEAARKQKTSNNTLAKIPVLAQKDYLQIIKNYKLPYQDAMTDLYQSHIKAFPEWSFEMDQNYSLCLTGYGSKKSLIQAFCARESQTFGSAYVVINGYHPSIDLRQICDSITTGLGSSGMDVQAVIAALDAMEYDCLILAINNIDGENLRSEKVQSQLTKIVMHPSVRLICSIDHINAPLLFSSTRCNDLHLLFHDATTFIPYTTETELQMDVLSSSTKTALVGDRGIKWILQTLSQNARSIFRILLLEQIETGFGMDSTRLFEKASLAFAVSNKTSYNAQLGEFLDHEIIVTDKGSDSNAEVLRIPFTKTELQRLLEDIDGGDASD